MPPTLRWSIVQELPYAVLRLVGTLDDASADAVRRGIAKCLAAEPEAVVVDVDELLIPETGALTVFAVASREAARWPGARLMLYCRDPNAALRIRKVAAMRYIPVFPTLEAAMASVERDSAPIQLSAQLMPTVGAARQARDLVTEACARWDQPDLVGPACTVVTELVNNVVVHAGTPMEVVLRLRDRYLNIAVRDGNTEPPVATGPVTPTSPGGRGLMMVAAVAQNWGFTPVTGGKVVWAVVYLPQ